MNAEIGKIIAEHCAAGHLGGSTAVLGPADGRDQDWVVLALPYPRHNEVTDALKAAGYVCRAAKEIEEGRELTWEYQTNDLWEKPGVDVTVCHEETHYLKWLLALQVARELKVAERKHRIILYQAIRFGVFNPTAERLTPSKLSALQQEQTVTSFI